jgi:hypothetical protein
VTKFKFKVLIFICFLIFVFDQGRPTCGPRAETFFVAQTGFRIWRIAGILIIFPSVFWQTATKLWEKLICGPETNFGLDAPGLDCERWSHRFEGGLCRLAAGIDVKIILSLAVGCPVGLAWFSWFQNISRKIDGLLSQELATKFYKKTDKK